MIVEDRFRCHLFRKFSPYIWPSKICSNKMQKPFASLKRHGKMLYPCHLSLPFKCKFKFQQKSFAVLQSKYLQRDNRSFVFSQRINKEKRAQLANQRSASSADLSAVVHKFPAKNQNPRFEMHCQSKALGVGYFSADSHLMHEPLGFGCSVTSCGGNAVPDLGGPS